MLPHPTPDLAPAPSRSPRAPLSALPKVCNPSDIKAPNPVSESDSWVMAECYDEGRIFQIGDYIIGDENCSLLYGLPSIRY